MTDTLHREEFLAGYVAEAHEHLAAARRAALAADEAVARGQPVPRPTRELFRALHTLKGLSGMIGVEPIVDLAHEMETVLRAADRAGGRLRREALDALLQGLEVIEDRVGHVARREPVPAAPRALLDALAQLEAPAQGGAAPALDVPPELATKLGPAEREQLASGVAEGRRAVRLDFTPSAERAARGLDISAVRTRVEAIAEIVKVVPRSSPREEGAPAGLVFTLVVLTSATPQELAEVVEAPLDAIQEIQVVAAAQPAQPAEDPVPGRAGPHAFVRVEVARLDEALEHVSALLVSRARLARELDALAAAGADVRSLRLGLQDHGRELRQLRTAVMRARLVRVAEVLERAPLLVRGLAQGGRKEVRLAMEVGEAEVDKAVGERLFPALVHLLRNAVDHAIELPAERRGAGKPAEGTIRITAAHRGEGELELAISDDGRGIDAAAVARKASAPVPATPRELLELISRPGLSTMSAPSRTSGRGIGMDVVRRIVESDLGGTLDLSTSPRQGTTFTLRVPVSLTIVDGLTFACAGETFVVPTATVDELVDVDPDRLIAGPAPRRRGVSVRMLRWRGETVPFFELRDVLGLARPGASRKGIVLKRDGAAIGFGVDRMLGRQEVVIRSLRDPLVERAGIAGATDLGDGKPTLVLDLVALARTLPVTAQEGV